MPEEELEETQTKPTTTVDLKLLREGLNPSGLDPDLEIKAEEYAKRDWLMSFRPVLERCGMLDDVKLVSTIQETLFQIKYEYLENKEDKAKEAKQLNLRWAL